VKILFINQVYPPDPAATGQQQASLAQALVERGHEVTVITSNRGYSERADKFPSKEIIAGVRIYRVWSSAFGKNAKWKRAVDFATYFFSCLRRAILLKRHDIIITLTTPPLVSIIGAGLARLWKARFIYWVMDLNPDEAIAAQWLKENGIMAKILETISRISFRSASAIIALDHFMSDRIVKKGVPASHVHALAPWSHDRTLHYDRAGRESFRKMHGFENKFVIMYSGNHSPCHPLDSILQAVLELKDDPDYVWCFVGGGTEQQNVIAFRERYQLQQQIICLPYQPYDSLSASLSAADLHCVVMGNPFVGIVHPCKIYNILRLGIPCLCIAPAPSHLSKLTETVGNPNLMRIVSHEDIKGIKEAFRDFKRLGKGRCEDPLRKAAEPYTENVLIPKHIDVILGSRP
jgi:glycosyltransferase involved in cell wall biosynthesis